MFISQTETVGESGKRTNSRFAVDLTGLESIFSEVHRFSWQAVFDGSSSDLGPHISLEGRVEGNNMWLRIVSEPPPQFDAGRIADTNQRQFFDLW